jgi:hypothetical protein
MHPLKIVSVYGDRTGTETKPITRACSVFPGSPFFGGDDSRNRLVTQGHWLADPDLQTHVTVTLF